MRYAYNCFRNSCPRVAKALVKIKNVDKCIKLRTARTLSGKISEAVRKYSTEHDVRTCRPNSLRIRRQPVHGLNRAQLWSESADAYNSPLFISRQLIQRVYEILVVFTSRIPRRTGSEVRRTSHRISARSADMSSRHDGRLPREMAI